MLTIVKRTEEELDAWVATEAGFITAFCRYDDEPITLEPYQLHFLENTSRFRWVTKARQVGYSFLIALEALARCHLRPKHTTVFVSYNLSDATEKILVARQVYEDLPLAFQKKLVTDSKMELAFESNSDKRGLSRIISHPSKAPRGKKGDVVLDELAHYVADREVYRGSTALILRSAAQLTGCSTPLGRRGIFWEVATQELRPYRHHWRQEVPWWLCRFFCHDVRTAARDAPGMTTEERVARFGNDKIIEQLDSLTVDDFQAEFECVPAGTLINVEGGVTEIEAIESGSLVLTHAGQLQPVLRTFSRPFSGSLVRVETYHTDEPLRLTPEHPVLALTLKACVYERQLRCMPTCMQACPHHPISLPAPEYVPASDLTLQHVLLFPVPERRSEDAPTVLRLCDWFGHRDSYRIRNRLPNSVPLSNALLRLAGYYLAEGSPNLQHRRRIEFCLHADETDYADEIRDSLRDIFGLRSDVRVVENGMKVGVNSVVLTNIFIRLFGGLQNERRIPVDWMALPDDRLWLLASAYFNGDGCRTNTVYVATTCSRTLAYQLREILVRRGLVPTLRTSMEARDTLVDGHRAICQRQYEVRVHRHLTDDGRGRRGWNDGEFVHLPVRSVAREPYSGTVHNLAVAGDESYVVGYHAVHNCSFVDESYSYYPYDLILPCTHDDLRVAEDVAAIPAPTGRLVAGFDVGRTRDRSELSVFDEVDGDFTCVYSRSFGQVAFAEQEGELRRLLNTVPIARLSIDRTGIGMNLAENLEREFPQVVAENFTNESKERWATDFKILLQRRAVRLPRHRDIVAQIHSIKRRVLASGKVSFDAEKTRSGHADKFWAIALACQKERTPGREPAEIGVRVIGGEARRIVQTPTLPFEEEILVEPLSADPAALEALSATLRLLGADLARRQNGEPICHRGLCWVAAPVERAALVRYAMLQQGYVRRVIT